MVIHPTAVVSPSAVVAEDVHIGPFCLIEELAVIGRGCQLASSVVVKRGTRLGQHNKIDVGAVLGADPQHLGAGARVGETVVGDYNQIREYVTVHRGFQPDSTTRIGDHNMLMAASHVGHDSVVGDHNILANNVMLAGHVVVGQRNYIGGGAAFHQFCRVGSYTMVGGLAQIKRDVPPFVMVDGATACLVGINHVGLRRAGVSVEDRKRLKEAYRLAFRSGLPLDVKLEALKKAFPQNPARLLWEFLSEGTRGCLTDRRGKRHAPSSTDEPRILPFRRAA